VLVQNCLFSKIEDLLKKCSFFIIIRCALARYQSTGPETSTKLAIDKLKKINDRQYNRCSNNQKSHRGETKTNKDTINVIIIIINNLPKNTTPSPLCNQTPRTTKIIKYFADVGSLIVTTRQYLLCYKYVHKICKNQPACRSSIVRYNGHRQHN
jgi:hypothetical protein